MTAEEHMKAAERARDLALIGQRIYFQEKYPHYTPPPFMRKLTTCWNRWGRANVNLHGLVGFSERFHPYTGTNKTLGGCGYIPTDNLMEFTR